MATLEFPELSEEVLAALRRRASAHHRSLQMEVRLILEEAVRTAPAEAKRVSIASELRMASQAPTDHAGGRWSREELYDDDGR